MTMTLTPAEIEAEKQYRIQERLGILCGSAEPTPEQLRLAQYEADVWEMQMMD